MACKADNDSPLIDSSCSHQSVDQQKIPDDLRAEYRVISFKHRDSALLACLYFDDETGLWIIEYTRSAQVISSALYQSKSTAYLMLHSHGYKQSYDTAC